MPPAWVRSSAIALIIALLFGLVAAPGIPAVAAPSPEPTVSTTPEVGFAIDDEEAPSAEEYGQFYYYWSVGFLEGMVRGDDRLLMDDEVLRRLGPRKRYRVGQVEHLLVAWFRSETRKALEIELAELKSTYDEEAEKRISDEGAVLDEAEKEQIRAEATAKYEEAAAERIDAVWRKYIRAYITVHNNRMRGKSFELELARLLGIDVRDPRWRYDQRLPKVEGLRQARRGDLWSDELGWFGEFKSGREISEEQLDDLLLIADALAMGELKIFFGGYPTKKAREMIEKKLREIEGENKTRAEEGERLKPTISARHVPLTAVPVDIRKMPAGQTFRTMPAPGLATASPAATGPPPSGQPLGTKPSGPTDPDSGPPGTLGAAGQQPADGTADELVAGSPESPEDAALFAQVADEEAAALGYSGADEAGMAPQHLGGVDFSTLELRYIADTYDGGVGRGVEYAYQVDPDDDAEVSYGGRQAAQLAADSFHLAGAAAGKLHGQPQPRRTIPDHQRRARQDRCRPGAAGSRLPDEEDRRKAHSSGH